MPNRMRAALAAEPMAINDVRHPTTATFGATSWKPGVDTSMEALIRVADDALYRAKNQGCNCVVVLPPGSGDADPQS